MLLLSMFVPAFLIAYKWSAKARSVEMWLGIVLNAAGVLVSLAICRWGGKALWGLLAALLCALRCAVHIECIASVNAFVPLERELGLRK